MNSDNLLLSRRKLIKIVSLSGISLFGSVLIDINNQNMKVEAYRGGVIHVIAASIVGTSIVNENTWTRRWAVGLFNSGKELAEGIFDINAKNSNQEIVANGNVPYQIPSQEDRIYNTDLTYYRDPNTLQVYYINNYQCNN